MVTKKRSARLKMTEFDENFSDELENPEVRNRYCVTLKCLSHVV